MDLNISPSKNTPANHPYQAVRNINRDPSNLGSSKITYLYRFDFSAQGNSNIYRALAISNPSNMRHLYQVWASTLASPCEFSTRCGYVLYMVRVQSGSRVWAAAVSTFHTIPLLVGGCSFSCILHSCCLMYPSRLRDDHVCVENGWWSVMGRGGGRGLHR